MKIGGCSKYFFCSPEHDMMMMPYDVETTSLFPNSSPLGSVIVDSLFYKPSENQRNWLKNSQVSSLKGAKVTAGKFHLFFI